jgi:hypothetical protein
MERTDQSFNAISWNPMMELENQMTFNEQYLPPYPKQHELYLDDSASETDLISAMSDLCPSFPHFPIMPYHRSPPGFPPLPFNPSGSFTPESFQNERVVQSEVKVTALLEI